MANGQRDSEHGTVGGIAMHHYTLNTGHSRISPRSEVGDDVIEFMQLFLESGDYDLHQNFPGWSLKTTNDAQGLLATLAFKNQPVVTIGVVSDDDEADVLWPMLESMYHNISELPLYRAADFAATKKPPSAPWCAVVLVQPLLCTDWMGDFQRCLAWAWIEERLI